MRRPRTLVPVVLLCCFAATAAQGGRKSSDPLQRALGEKFPKAPATLDSDLDATGIVLLDTTATKPFRTIGAILERKSDGELIRTSRFEKNLILFHHLEPDVYALRLLKFKDFMANNLTATLSKDDAPTIDVKSGAVHYLGVVRTRVKTVFNSTTVVEYDRAREVEAWEQFKRSYAGSSWEDVVDQRIAAIRLEAAPER